MHKNTLSLNVKKYLVETLIFPHLDYACVPLINCSDVLNLKLERALNSAIRFVYRIPRFFHISSYRNQLNWLKIEQRRLYFLANALHLIINSGKPYFLACKFIHLNSMPHLRRSIRLSNEVLFVTTPKTVMFEKSFTIAGARLWNSLGTRINTLTDPVVFKEELFNFLLSFQIFESSFIH